MERIDAIVTAINAEYKSKKGIFEAMDDLLEYQVPQGVTPSDKFHARFYFFLIFNDHGTKSRTLYEKFKNLYTINPSIFNPIEVINNQETWEELKLNGLNSLGLRYPTNAAKAWFENSRILVEKYKGEPENLFKSTGNAVELFYKIKSFKGYGPKTTGLLLRVVIGMGFNRNLSNISNVPLPVDIHDSRIAFICGIYRPETANDVFDIYSNPKHIKEVSRAWQTSAERLKIDWEELDRALWLLGSRGCAKKLCLECPIVSYCDIGREVKKSQPTI